MSKRFLRACAIILQSGIVIFIISDISLCLLFSNINSILTLKVFDQIAKGVLELIKLERRILTKVRKAGF